MKTLKITFTTMILMFSALVHAQQIISANGIEISIQVVDESGVGVGSLLGETKKDGPIVLAACCVQPEKSDFTKELVSKMQTIANLAVNSSGICDKPGFNRKLSALLSAKMQLPADAVKDGKSTLQILLSDITQPNLLSCLAN
jgi:hypothetical protein